MTRPSPPRVRLEPDPRRVVFLSYAQPDRANKIFARLQRDLRALDGIQLWLDEERLPAGSHLGEALAHAVELADFFVPVISKTSHLSRWAPQEFFFAYADQLRHQRLKILPVRIDAAKMPPYLASAEVIDLHRNYRRGFSRLAAVLVETPGQRLATFQIDKPVVGTSTIVTVADEATQKLIEHFSRHPQEMKRLDRRRFEELVAELFDGFGYEVELTKQTRDGGRDVIAVRQKEVSVKYLIECKRPDPGNPVGVRPVRELFGVRTDEGATKAILATTAHFSKDALLFFERHRWELEARDYDGLLEWIEEYLRQKLRRSREAAP